MGIWKKFPPESDFFGVASFKRDLKFWQNQIFFKKQHEAKNLKFILGFGIFNNSHF